MSEISDVLGFDPAKTRKGQPTVTVKLTPVLEAALAAKASELGVSRVRVATQAIYEFVKDAI